MARPRKKNLRYAFLAVFIATVLWSIEHRGSTQEREFDVPIVFDGLPDDLVITDQTATRITVRVQGSRAAIRSLSESNIAYQENITGAQPGRARYEVDDNRLGFPGGVRVVALSPAQLDVRFERRGRKNVRVRPDLQGEPPEGFELGIVEVEPARIWLTGARSNVLRLSEVVTETIDLTGLDTSTEREVKLSIGIDHVWQEEAQPVTVRILIEVQPVADEAVDGEGGEQTG